jgi:serine/threonine protein kinase/tetratricopeptide (TPR) repeat protein
MTVMIGKSLNHYQVLEKLGAGGMGEVYLAEDIRLKRKVALKVLPGEMAADPLRLERFQREAEAVAALNHPNIVTIFSVEEAGGTHFLTMEFIAGKPLGDLIPADGLPLKRFFDIVLPLADAIDSAHRQGITHRDLKPANVMVTDEGRLKVLDFGLAKLIEPEAKEAGSTQLPTRAITREGIVMGTVPYMSPEQLEGKAVDPRTDVFSLGVLMYEMATGQRPFQGDSSASLISSILRDDPPLVTQLNAHLPRHLGRVVRRCLEKAPDRRYQATRDLRIELEDLKREIDSGEVELTGGIPVPAMPPSTGPAGSSPSGETPVPVATRRISGDTLVKIVVPIAALIFAGWFLSNILFDGNESNTGTRPPGPAPPATPGAAVEDDRKMIVVLPFENLGPPEDEYFAAGMSEEITSRLAAVSDLGVISRKSAQQYTDTEKSTRQIGDELGVDYILEGTIRWARGAGGASRVRITPQLIRVATDIQIWSDSYDRVIEDIFDLQSEIAEEVIDKLDVTLLEREREAVEEPPTDDFEAYQAYLRGMENFQHYTERETKLAAGLFERAVELDPDFLDAWYGLSRTHASAYLFGYDRSPEAESRSFRAAQKALELDPESPLAHMALGYFYYHVKKDYERALQEFATAKVGLPNEAEVYAAQGYVRRRQGNWEAARLLIDEAIELDPLNFSTVYDQGITFMGLRRHAEAQQMFERAIALRTEFLWGYLFKAWNIWIWKGESGLPEARATLKALPVSNDPKISWTWYWQEIFEGNAREAIRSLGMTPDQSIPVWPQVFPKSLLAAYAHQLAGETELARENYEAARVFLEERLNENPDDVGLNGPLGVAYAGLGRSEDAIRAGLRSVELYPMSHDAFFGAFILQDLAWIYTMVGDFDSALDIFEAQLTIPSTTTVAWLELDPRWAPLRDHPRFRKLTGTQ